MRTKATVAVLVVILVFYAVLIGAKGVAFIASGDPVAVLLGLGVLLLPVLGLALVWREIAFGRRCAANGNRPAHQARGRHGLRTTRRAGRRQPARARAR